MNVRIYSDFVELEKYAREWDALSEDSSEPNPCMDRYLLLPALRHLSRGKVVVFTAWASELVGLMAIDFDGVGKEGRLRLFSNFKHTQSFLATPLIRKGYETAFWHAFLDWMRGAFTASLFFRMEPISATGPIGMAFDRVLAERKHPCYFYRTYERGLVTSGLPSDVYIQTHISKSHRSKFEKLERKLYATGEVEFETVSPSASPTAQIEAYLQLEHSGWKGRERSSLLTSQNTAVFFREACLLAAEVGKLQFQQLKLNGRLIASLCNLSSGRTLFGWKTSYDDASSKLSPGVLIEIFGLRHFLDSKQFDAMDSCTAPGNTNINNIYGQRLALKHIYLPTGCFGSSSAVLAGRLATKMMGRRLGFQTSNGLR